MLRKFSQKRTIGFFLFDWLGTLLMIIAAARLRIEIGFIPTQLSIFLESLGIPYTKWWAGLNPEDILVTPVLLLVTIIWPSIFIIFSVYEGKRNQTLFFELVNVLIAIIASTLILGGLLFLTYRDTSRVAFVIFFVLDVTLLLGVRIAWYTYRLIIPKQNRNLSRKVLIVGYGEVGKSITTELNTYLNRDLEVVGFLDDNKDFQKQNEEQSAYLGELSNVLNIVDQFEISDSIIALPLREHQKMVDICKVLQNHGVHVHVIPDLFDITFPGSNLHDFGGLPVIDLGDPYILGYWQIVKKIVDRLLVAFSLIFLAPLFLLTAILIKLDSPGPVFFLQTRIGFSGKPFQLIKFRTMLEDADQELDEILQRNPQLEQEWKEYQKLSDDPRITRVGKRLRQLSLDELPQIWNIMRGEMSLIGPRPFLPEQIEMYGERAYNDYIRVHPGLTGMWQVSGRNETSFATRAQWDIYYIRNWSILLDISIFFKTIGVLVRRIGAY